MNEPILLVKIKENIHNYDWIKIHDFGYDSDGDLKTLMIQTKYTFEAIDFDEEFEQDVLPCYMVFNAGLEEWTG